MAVGFFYGDTLNATINDPSLFSITMEQCTKYKQINLTSPCYPVNLVLKNASTDIPWYKIKKNLSFYQKIKKNNKDWRKLCLINP